MTITTHHRADTGHEFARVERFDQIIISACLQSNDLVDLIAYARQHNDGQVIFLSDVNRQHQPAFSAQTQINKGKINGRRVAKRMKLCTVGTGNRTISALLKQGRKGLADLRIVVNDGDHGLWFGADHIKSMS